MKVKEVMSKLQNLTEAQQELEIGFEGCYIEALAINTIQERSSVNMLHHIENKKDPDVETQVKNVIMLTYD